MNHKDTKTQKKFNVSNEYGTVFVRTTQRSRPRFDNNAIGVSSKLRATTRGRPDVNQTEIVAAKRTVNQQYQNSFDDQPFTGEA
jgi:hypothetical protein